MGDPGKFQNLILYYCFNISLLSMISAELFIFFFTYQKRSVKKKWDLDKGTKWLLYANFVLCICMSFYAVSQKAPAIIRNMVLPSYISFLGMILIVAGVFTRIVSVLTLKKAFTLNVQTTDTQQLVTTGIYRTIRNPAYTGSIISLLGVSLSLRNITSILVVFLSCLICYSVRISIEEKALEKRFQESFREYVKHTYKLFPYIW